VSYDEAKAFADSMGLILLETSAKNAHNVEQSFTKMANEIKSKVKNVAGPPKAAKLVRPGQPVKQGGCCG
jgi:Ras-related protein Rab-1A